jgi:predicted enzyme related to lactoylglutathione lyase
MLGNATAMHGFAVDDKAKAKEFYGETLGLKVSEGEMGPLLNIDLGAPRPTIIYEKPDFEPATYTILNFEVDDIDKTVDDLNAAGLELERYEGFDQDEKGIARGAPDGSEGPSIAWFKDPAGNILSVLAAANSG